MKSAKFQTRAFTVLEGLLVLFISSFILFLFTSNMKKTIQLVRGELFVLQFERLYKDTQHRAGLKNQSETLISQNGKISSKEEVIELPREAEINDFSITFDDKAGNSSLQKIIIYLPYQRKTISYQLEIGSGKYNKTIS